MALTENTTVDQITVTENGTVLYRNVIRVYRDDIEISKAYNRASLTPGGDLTGVPPQVVAICEVVWTPEVIAAYQQWIETNNLA